jgi:hypothetical protein
MHRCSQSGLNSPRSAGGMECCRCRADNGWRIQLDVLNLFNTQANQITYAYGSLLKTDSLYNL